MAGLWKRTISKDLLWFNNSEKRLLRTAHTAADSWTAPTWSWASLSVGQEIRFLKFQRRYPGALRESREFLLTMDKTISVIKCKPKGENDLGELERGMCFFKARARLLPCFLRHFTKRILKNQNQCMLDLDDHIDQIHANGLCEPQHAAGKAYEPEARNLHFHPDGHVKKELKFTGRCKDCSVARVWLLHAAVNTSDNQGHDAFLVLTEVSSKDVAFERVGLATFWSDTSSTREDWFRTVWERKCTTLQEITVF